MPLERFSDVNKLKSVKEANEFRLGDILKGSVDIADLLHGGSIPGEYLFLLSWLESLLCFLPRFLFKPTKLLTKEIWIKTIQFQTPVDAGSVQV